MENKFFIPFGKYTKYGQNLVDVIKGVTILRMKKNVNILSEDIPLSHNNNICYVLIL